MIPERVPVPPPLPTTPLPSRRNVATPPHPPPTPPVRRPWRTLCHKRAVRVLVTSGVLTLLILLTAVTVMAVFLGSNTRLTNKEDTNNTLGTNINIS